MEPQIGKDTKLQEKNISINSLLFCESSVVPQIQFNTFCYKILVVGRNIFILIFLVFVYFQVLVTRLFFNLQSFQKDNNLQFLQ